MDDASVGAGVSLLGRLVRRLGMGVDGVRDLYCARRRRVSAATSGEDFGVAGGKEAYGEVAGHVGQDEEGVDGNWRRGWDMAV